MNNLTFATSYERLSAAERGFCDAFVRQVGEQAERAGVARCAVLDNLPNSGVEFDWRTQEFLGFERVQSAIRERCAALDYATAISQDRVRREIATIAFSSFETMVSIEPDEFGGYDARLSPEKWTREQWASVAEWKEEELAQGGKRKITVKLWPKLQALKMLGDHNGMFDPNNPHRVKETSREVARQMQPLEFREDTPVEAVQEAYARLLQRNAT